MHKDKLQPARTNWKPHLSVTASKLSVVGYLLKKLVAFPRDLQMHLVQDTKKLGEDEGKAESG